MSKSVRASGKIFAINGLSEGTGLLRVSIMAYLFGAGRTMDAFFAAMVLYNLCVKLLQAGALSSVFLPLYLEAKASAIPEKRWSSVEQLMNVGLLIGVGIMILAMVAAPVLVPLLVPGFDAPTQQTVVHLFCLMSPIVPMTLYTSIAISVLNAERQFGRPEATMLAGQITNLAVILVSVRFFGVYALAVGSLFSNGLQCLIFAGSLRGIGYRHHWTSALDGKLLGDTFRVLRPYYGYLAVMQVASLFSVGIISFLPAGSLSVYRYGSDLVSRIAGFIAKPINIVAYTSIAEANVSMAPAESASRVRKALFATLVVSAGATALLFSTSRPLVDVLLDHGAFKGSNVSLLASGISIMSVMFFFNGVSDLLSRTLVSLKKTVEVNVVAVILQFVGVSVLWALTRTWGIEGAFVATPITTAVGALLFAIGLVVVKFPLLTEPNVKSYLQVLAAAVAAGGVGFLVGAALPNAGAVIQLLSTGLSASVSYVVFCTLLGLDEMRVLLSSIVGRLSERRLPV